MSVALLEPEQETEALVAIEAPAPEAYTPADVTHEIVTASDVVVEPPLGASDFCYLPHEAFRGRNKSFGAYPLRRYYQRRLLTALAVGSVAFSLGITSPIIYERLGVDQRVGEEFSRVVELTRIEQPPLDPKQPPPPEVAPPPPPKVATVRFVPPEVAHDEEVADEEIPPPQEELKEVQASTITQEGDPNVNPDEIIVEDPVNESASEVVGTPPAERPDEVFVVVEVMPEIKGGAQEVYKHLQYPEIARQAGMEGLVVVQVVVEPNGRPSDPMIARSAGEVLDDAAIAAVMRLEFIPGKQRGNAVRVKYAVPIRFRLRNDKL